METLIGQTQQKKTGTPVNAASQGNFFRVPFWAHVAIGSSTSAIDLNTKLMWLPNHYSSSFQAGLQNTRNSTIMIILKLQPPTSDFKVPQIKSVQLNISIYSNLRGVYIDPN